jgi:hypothetical protein
MDMGMNCDFRFRGPSAWRRLLVVQRGGCVAAQRGGNGFQDPGGGSAEAVLETSTPAQAAFPALGHLLSQRIPFAPGLFVLSRKFYHLFLQFH